MALAGADREAVVSRIAVVPDWPQPGVAFQDLSGVLADGEALSAVIRGLRSACGAFDIVAGIEARGFPYGAALAFDAGTGLVTLRKPGKLPRAVHAQAYELEYGVATLELHQDAIAPGSRVLVVDDVLATGGTAAAAIALVRRAGAIPVGLGVVMEIPVLGGRGVVEATGVPVHALLEPIAFVD